MLRRAVVERPATVVVSGLILVVPTPFLFFPGIMGEAGVTHAGRLRNGPAVAPVLVGVLLALSGSAGLAWRVLRGSRRAGNWSRRARDLAAGDRVSRARPTA